MRGDVGGGTAGRPGRPRRAMRCGLWALSCGLRALCAVLWALPGPGAAALVVQPAGRGGALPAPLLPLSESWVVSFFSSPPPPPGTPRSAFLSPPFPFSLCTPAVCAFVPSSRILRGRGWSEVLSSSLQLFRGLLKRSSVFSSRLFMQTRGQHLQHRLHQVQDPRPGDGDGAV